MRPTLQPRELFASSAHVGALASPMAGAPIVCHSGGLEDGSTENGLARGSDPSGATSSTSARDLSRQGSIGGRAGQAITATKETALLAAHRSAEAANMAAGSVAAAPSAAAASVEYLVTSIAAGLYMNKERCKALLLKTTYETRRQVLGNFKDLIKTNLTEDPHMCKFIKASIERLIDRLWSEVEDEIERDLEAVVLEQLANEDIRGPLGTLLTKWYWRCRAFILNHYFPHNKSIFGKLQDPVYICILILAVAPICGARFVIFSVILLMVCVPGPPDEYMLFNFIMLFKGYQFISTGLLKSFWETMVYIYCYSVPEDNGVRACAHRHGPASFSYVSLVADYVGNVVLTWIAWSALGRSVKYAENRFIVDGGRLLDATEPKPVRVRRADTLWTPSRTRAPTNPKVGPAGGLFKFLMYYDVGCFLVSLVVLFFFSWSTCFRQGPTWRDFDHPQMKSNLFWCNVLFSVTAIPFQPLNIPWLFGVFTRSMPTGFNEKGACVPFKIAVLEVPKKKWRSQSTWQTLVDIKEFGRSRRQELKSGPTAAEGYSSQVSDFSYGLWRAVLYSEMDHKDASEVPADLVYPQEHLMTVWDRF